MKKVLSVALALVMLFAVCVPAFASQTITQPGDTAATPPRTSR